MRKWSIGLGIKSRNFIRVRISNNMAQENIWKHLRSLVDTSYRNVNYIVFSSGSCRSALLKKSSKLIFWTPLTKMHRLLFASLHILFYIILRKCHFSQFVFVRDVVMLTISCDVSLFIVLYLIEWSTILWFFLLIFNEGRLIRN